MPVRPQSIWSAHARGERFPVLNRDLDIETVVIGGGITGLSVAQALCERGQDVAVLEAREIGFGTTSGSTGNLYVTIDQLLAPLLKKYDIETVREVVQARARAIQLIETNVRRFAIDCSFCRVPMKIFATHDAERIEEERAILESAGASVRRSRSPDIPVTSSEAIELSNQAQLNPMRYVRGLADALHSERCAIFEQTVVSEITENDENIDVVTSNGTVRARKVVHATHTPKGLFFTHSLLGPYREYAIAFAANDLDFPEGIFWGYFGTNENEKKYSIRIGRDKDSTFLVVVGEHHQVGKSNDSLQRLKSLEDFARHHFSVGDVIACWGGQNYRSADMLPYIGRISRRSQTYIATGYATDGLVYGTVAGAIIADQIISADSDEPGARLFAADRSHPVKAAARFVAENVSNAKEYLAHIPGVIGDAELENLPRGDGVVISRKGHKIAAYRSESGELSLRSAVCPHMGCVVNWNPAERSWDCPCHGSRFTVDGTVIEGPALTSLPHIDAAT